MFLADRLITADDIIACRPCHEDDRVRELVPEPKLLSSILEMENVPAEDRVWAVVHLLSAKEAVYVAATVIRRTIWHLLTDERSRQAVEVAEKWVKGEVSDDEVTEAAWAVDRAAWADSAAYWTARAAAGAADAAWAVDRTYWAAWTARAAWATEAASVDQDARAVRAAASVDQIEIIRSLIRG